MFVDQNTERSHNIKIDNCSFEMADEFNYLETTIADHNSIQEEIKSRLKSGNSCNHSVQNLLSFILLFKDIKIQINRSIIFPFVLYGCETWSLTMREERKLWALENRALRRLFGPKRDEITGEGKKLHNEELNDLYFSPNIIRAIKSSRLRLAGHIAFMGERRGVYRVLVAKPERKISLGRPRHRWEDNIKMDLQEVRWGSWTRLILFRRGTVEGTFKCGNAPSSSIKC